MHTVPIFFSFILLGVGQARSVLSRAAVATTCLCEFLFTTKQIYFIIPEPICIEVALLEN